MNRTFLSIAIIVIVLVALGAAVLYRGPLLALFGSSTQQTATSTPQDSQPVWQHYASTTLGVALDYPPGYILSEGYKYTQFPGKPISGISFTVPVTEATGTNLSIDTKLSVEWLPHAKKCTGDIFINQNVKAATMLDNGVTYSLATSSGAGAGNLYEEQVYAIASSSPCTAVRYFIHTTQLANYPEGTVRAYDRDALLGEFDQMRKSLTLGSNAPAAQ